MLENAVKINMIRKKIKEITADFSVLEEKLLPEHPNQNLEDILITLTKLHTETSIICMKLEILDAKRLSVPILETADGERPENTPVRRPSSPVQREFSKECGFLKKEQFHFSKIYQFINFEETYCEELKILSTIYCPALADLLSRNQIKCIFGNVDALLKIHLIFIQELQEIQKTESYSTKIRKFTNVLLSSTELVRSEYCIYASNYPVAIKSLKELTIENSQVFNCLLDLQEDQNNDKTLEEYLHEPLLRIAGLPKRIYELQQDAQIELNSKDIAALEKCRSIFESLDLALQELLSQPYLESPCGIIQFFVFEARGIGSVDITGTSDSAVLIKVGDTEVCRTKAITNTGEPKWNQKFEIVLYASTILHSSEYLQMELIHSNTLMVQSIGKTEKLPIGKWIASADHLSKENQDLINSWGNPLKAESMQQQWQPLLLENGISQGSVRFNAVYIPLAADSSCIPDSPGVISVHILEGKFPTTLPYECKIKFEEKTISACTAVLGCNPIWNGLGSFYAEKLMPSSKLEVIVRSGLELVGMISIDVLESCESNSSRWFSLDKDKQIKMRVNFKALENVSPSDVKGPTPAGALKVTIISADSLPDTVSTVYVKSYLQGRKIGTTSVQDTLNEIQWNDNFYIPIYNFQEYLSFDLFESSTLVRDKKIGRVRVKLEELVGSANKLIMEDLDIWTPIIRYGSENTTIGSLHYHITFTPATASMQVSGIMRIIVGKCKFVHPGRYYLQFRSDDEEYFQTLACPEQVNEFNYSMMDDQFIPDLNNLDISILLRIQTLDKPLPHDRIAGSWFGRIDKDMTVNFTGVGESIIAGNSFGDVLDVGSAMISCQRYYVDLDHIKPAQNCGVFNVDLIKALFPLDNGTPWYFIVKLNGKDVHKTKEYKSIGDINESVSFRLNDRITSTLVIQLCRDQFSSTTVLATAKLPLDKVIINRQQTVEMTFDSPGMSINISYHFEANEVSRPSLISWDEEFSDKEFGKLGRRSTNQTRRQSTISKRSSVSRQSSYLSQ